MAKKKASVPPKKSIKVPALAPDAASPELTRWAVRRLLELAATVELDEGTFTRPKSRLRPAGRAQTSARSVDEKNHRRLLDDVVRLLVADARAAVDEDLQEILLTELRDRIRLLVSWAKDNVETAKAAALLGARPPEVRLAAIDGPDLFPDSPTVPFLQSDRWFHLQRFVANRITPSIQRVAITFFGEPIDDDRIRIALNQDALPGLFENDLDALALAIIGKLYFHGNHRSATTLRHVKSSARTERASMAAQRDRHFLRYTYAISALDLDHAVDGDDIARILVAAGR